MYKKGDVYYGRTNNWLFLEEIKKSVTKLIQDYNFNKIIQRKIKFLTNNESNKQYIRK